MLLGGVDARLRWILAVMAVRGYHECDVHGSTERTPLPLGDEFDEVPWLLLHSQVQVLGMVSYRMARRATSTAPIGSSIDTGCGVDER